MLKHYLVAMFAGAIMLAPAGYAHEAVQVDQARAAAILECNSLALRYPETTFASTEFELYRSCMARHGQME